MTPVEYDVITILGLVCILSWAFCLFETDKESKARKRRQKENSQVTIKLP